MVEFNTSTHGRFWYYTKEHLNEQMIQKYGDMVQKMSQFMDFNKQIAEKY